MGVAKVYAAAPTGFDGTLVEVEGHAAKGLPAIQIVGLANKSIDEAKERVKSALLNSLFEYPAKRLTINMAPAELPKEGTHYDLAIALAIMIVSGQLQQSDVAGCLFAGELALDGSIRPIKGIINMAETAKQSGLTTVLTAKDNAQQAALVEDITVIGVSTLKDLFFHLKHEYSIEPTKPNITSFEHQPKSQLRLDDVVGQAQAKRAITIAAAGRHNILLKGSPGTGKTMLAKTLHSLLPPPSAIEQLAITKMHSLSGENIDSILLARPFRSPHHTSSRIALIGGGTQPQPGEVSLAHLGVLFLDEIPEYPRSTLEALRQPLEDRQVSISRAHSKVNFPADIMLVATMNPCPCGYYGDQSRECICTQNQLLNYQKRLSGPLLDRIDLVITVPRVSQDALLKKSNTSTEHRAANQQIASALAMQHQRYDRHDFYNANLSSTAIRQADFLLPSSKLLLDTATEKLQLSTRAYFRIIRVARTIADLAKSPQIEDSHLAEALQYRLS